MAGDERPTGIPRRATAESRLLLSVWLGAAWRSEPRYQSSTALSRHSKIKGLSTAPDARRFERRGAGPDLGNISRRASEGALRLGPLIQLRARSGEEVRDGAYPRRELADGLLSAGSRLADRRDGIISMAQSSRELFAGALGGREQVWPQLHCV